MDWLLAGEGVRIGAVPNEPHNVYNDDTLIEQEAAELAIGLVSSFDQFGLGDRIRCELVVGQLGVGEVREFHITSSTALSSTLSHQLPKPSMWYDVPPIYTSHDVEVAVFSPMVAAILREQVKAVGPGWQKWQTTRS